MALTVGRSAPALAAPRGFDSAQIALCDALLSVVAAVPGSGVTAEGCTAAPSQLSSFYELSGPTGRQNIDLAINAIEAPAERGAFASLKADQRLQRLRELLADRRAYGPGDLPRYQFADHALNVLAGLAGRQFRNSSVSGLILPGYGR